jgi:hypothetical protein
MQRKVNLHSLLARVLLMVNILIELLSNLLTRYVFRLL